MAGKIEAKLAELGITLPTPIAPIANYVPAVTTGNLVFVSGQVPAVDGKIAVTGMVQCGYVYVDGMTVGEVTEASLKDRLILGDEGFLSVVVVVDSTNGKLVAGPEIHARGSGIDDAAFDAIRPLVEEALKRAAADGVSEMHQLRQLIRRTAGRWVSDNYRRRPMIIPVVVQV